MGLLDRDDEWVSQTGPTVHINPRQELIADSS
jgi:hypothetical protein